MPKSNQKPNKSYQQGFSTLEILLAMAILIITLSGAALVAPGAGSSGATAALSGAQSLWTDSRTNSEALRYAQANLEEAQASSRNEYDSVVDGSETINDGIDYNVSRKVSDITQCSKKISSIVAWGQEYGRTGNVSLVSKITNIPLMMDLGGNCDAIPPSYTTCGWNPPATYNCDNFNPGKPTSIDVFGETVCMGGDKEPYLFLADMESLAFQPSCGGPSHDLFVGFDNGFSDSEVINDITVAKASNDRVYAYAARDAATMQFEIIDITDIKNPVSKGEYSLAGAGGSEPEGYRIYYFDKKIYITTKETEGPEFHVFDVSTPWNPASVLELGVGTELNTTVEDFVVTKQDIGGNPHNIAYMATDGNSHELLVIDATNSPAVEISNAAGNLPNNQDGASLSMVGNTLYFGRMSSAGSDLYVFNIQDPENVIKIAEKDIGTSVIGISVSGYYAFLATSKANLEFQVWTSDPGNIGKVDTTGFNFPNLIPNGIKYSNNFVYVASEGNDALRILYDNATACP